MRWTKRRTKAVVLIRQDNEEYLENKSDSEEVSTTLVEEERISSLSKLSAISPELDQKVKDWSNHGGPCHQLFQLTKSPDLIGRVAASAGFLLVGTYRQNERSKQDWISDTLWATKGFHLDAWPLNQFKTTSESVQAYTVEFSKSKPARTFLRRWKRRTAVVILLHLEIRIILQQNMPFEKHPKIRGFPFSFY